MAGRILVGVDGSEGSRRALRWAIEEAAARGAVLDAVIVKPGPRTSRRANYPVDEVKAAEKARERLRSASSERAHRVCAGSPSRTTGWTSTAGCGPATSPMVPTKDVPPRSRLGQRTTIWPGCARSKAQVVAGLQRMIEEDRC